MSTFEALSMAELEAGLPTILDAPKDEGSVALIVRRPEVNTREVIEQGELTMNDGLVGDSWRARAGADADAQSDMQLTLMNARVIAHVAQSQERWPLAGDQLYVDFDLSQANLPSGSQLQIGEAIIEVSAEPHTGCRKFVDRFGKDAMIFVNSRFGKQHCLRGINAKVIQNGRVRQADKVVKLINSK